jgi:AraC-like DNA-binding protein
LREWLGQRMINAVSAVTAGTMTKSLCRARGAGHLVEVRCRAGRRERPYPEEHTGWTVALVRRGVFEYRAADTNRTHTLRPGWLLLGRPRATYECSHEHDGGDDCAALYLAPEVIEEVASSTRGCRGAVFPAPVHAPITRVAALIDRLAAGAVDLDEAAYDIAAAIVARAHEAPVVAEAVGGSHRARVDAAVAQIEMTCHQPIRLADLAAHAGLSPFHFLRLFRRATGTTPHQYVVGARLRRAARLLVDTARPVTEIAYQVGFEDLSNFVRTFHRAVGCSPRTFRRRA